ncbi:MAG: hypothetical protein IKH54_01780 [Bacilli bacterium]|nr:hypothetical protein [Bacilli bacterium]
MIIVAINLALNFSSLLFLIFIMVVYFSKKNMKNMDNTLYRLLLIFNFLNSFIHMFFLLAQWFRLNDVFIMKLIIRGYWIPVQLYMIVLMFYVIITIKNDDKKFMSNLLNNNKKFYLILTGVLLFQTMMFFILPFNVMYDSLGDLETIDGPATMYFLLVFVIFLFVNAYTIFKYRKKEDRKKILPFKVLFVFIIVGFILSAIYTTLCVTEYLVTIITYLMFHTIENPDLKLVNELTLAKESAEKANNAKSDFLSSMSHELRTPLNAIVGLTQSIMDADNLDTVKEDSKDILTASEKLLELVDSILDINKLESNNMELISVNYAPIEVFNDLVKVMGVRIGDKPIELRCRFSEDLPNTLYGDKDKIKQVITNLISNAIKYTDSGTVDFSVDCINKDNKSNLRISVSDSGRGIKDEELNNLFTKFYRREEDKDTDVEGAGLGLAITKSLVDLMGGKISVDSIDGVGTTFLVSISQDIVSNSINNEESEVL